MKTTYLSPDNGKRNGSYLCTTECYSAITWWILRFARRGINEAKHKNMSTTGMHSYLESKVFGFQDSWKPNSSHESLVRVEDKRDGGRLTNESCYTDWKYDILMSSWQLPMYKIACCICLSENQKEKFSMFS